MKKINQFLEKIKQVQKCKTADGVARFLKKRKIKGHVNSDSSCPLAKFFFGLNKGGDGSVDSDNISFVYTDDVTNIEVNIRTSDAMSDFIARFDDGKYPALDLNG